MSKGTLRQILLLTDGCSNEGQDPVAVAAMAKEQGITINVIGILDEGHLGEQGIREVEEIAAAGGGVHQVVYSRELSRTVQMVTRQAMTQTIHQVVNQELRHILGEEEVDALPPAKRGEVVEVVEHLGETVDLDLLILVDTSASMRRKLPAVKQALQDLKLSLQSRSGENRFSLWTYPHSRGDAYKHWDFSTDLEALDHLFSSLTAQGTTPTGPALEEVLNYFVSQWSHWGSDGEGMLRRYGF